MTELHLEFRHFVYSAVLFLNRINGFINAQQLVIFYHPFSAAGSARFQKIRPQSDCKVGNGAVTERITLQPARFAVCTA